MLKQQFQIKLSQKLSPQQIQLMKMIQLSTLELEQKIESEMGENPALENGKESLKNDDNETNYDEDNKDETNEININQFQYQVELASINTFHNKSGI